MSARSPARCGAEIAGVDIADDLDDDVIAEIRQALIDHGVIFFRDQDLDAASTRRSPAALARSLSTRTTAASGRQRDRHIRREPGDQHIVGEDWHADTTMMEEPPMGAILYAIEVPPYGGDTLFANQYLAYDTLSDGMKARCKTCARCTATAWSPGRSRQ